MKPVRVCLEGERYGEAYLALRRARRAWHRLDAALIDLRHLTPSVDRTWEALAALDRQLARLTTLLIGEISCDDAGLTESTPHAISVRRPNGWQISCRPYRARASTN
jgi:hypothetical protein